MIEWAQLRTASRKREAEWSDYRLPDHYLTGFVAEHSDEFARLESDLREYFSMQALIVILAAGVITIDANRRGARMWSVGSGGLREGSLEDGEKLAAAFQQWAKIGEIVFNPALGEGVTAAHLVEK